MSNFQAFDHVWIAWVGMITIHGSLFAPFYQPQQPFLSYHAAYPLAIDRYFIRKMPVLIHHEASAVGRKLTCDTLDGCFQLDFLDLFRLVVKHAARQPKDFAHH